MHRLSASRNTTINLTSWTLILFALVVLNDPYIQLTLDATTKIINTAQDPYATLPCGWSEEYPEAMKLVSGLLVSLAAEHRAIVGELLEITSVK